MDVSLYDVQGVHAAKPSKYSPISTLRWIGGLQTQRSVFAALDSRYNQRYLGGKPDALIAGSNCEINNKLNPSTTVLATRFFLSPGTSPPVCRHLQVQLSGTTVGTQDEILSLTLRGEILNESE